MGNISRREFFKRSLVSGATGAAVLTGVNKKAEASEKLTMATLIDLSLCNGCTGDATPACVNACRHKNESNYPQPVTPIPVNWPTGKKEDWSKKKGDIDKLTPYNWTYVQEIKVEHAGQQHNIFIQRRCMHCDNPPCASLCPFGVQNQTEEGPVVIDRDYCLGGAKCRDVCPWNIPQRQAGVGIYMKIAPGLLGGGVMYKCDLCIDLIRQNKPPACVSACPQKAITFGDKETIRKLAHQRAKDISGYIYGEKENGGTSTLYVSPVPFDKINNELTKVKAKTAKPDKVGVPLMQPEVENYLDSGNGMLLGYAIAPVAGALTAGIMAFKSMKGDD